MASDHWHPAVPQGSAPELAKQKSPFPIGAIHLSNRCHPPFQSVPSTFPIGAIHLSNRCHPLFLSVPSTDWVGVDQGLQLAIGRQPETGVQCTHQTDQLSPRWGDSPLRMGTIQRSSSPSPSCRGMDAAFSKSTSLPCQQVQKLATGTSFQATDFYRALAMMPTPPCTGR
jgi:hypothetical protein